MAQPRHLLLLAAATAAGALTLAPAVPARSPELSRIIDPLTGPRSRLARDWVGLGRPPADTEILVMAGHADSQGIAGAGTGGEAVDLRGAAPMRAGIRDELHWNLLTAQAVVAVGQRRGLAIRFYDPQVRTIADADDPRTNWSVGKAHASQGGYALEIHYDAYGPDGVGSGLIPPLHRPPSQLDESLAAAFGDYPMRFRGGLGAPRRGIAILEIGKLEGSLEAALRDAQRRQPTIDAIALRVVEALERGLGRGNRRSAPVDAARAPLSSPPDGGRSAR